MAHGRNDILSAILASSCAAGFMWFLSKISRLAGLENEFRAALVAALLVFVSLISFLLIVII